MAQEQREPWRPVFEEYWKKAQAQGRNVGEYAEAFFQFLQANGGLNGVSEEQARAWCKHYFGEEDKPSYVKKLNFDDADDEKKPSSARKLDFGKGRPIHFGFSQQLPSRQH